MNKVHGISPQGISPLLPFIDASLTQDIVSALPIPVIDDITIVFNFVPPPIHVRVMLSFLIRVIYMNLWMLESITLIWCKGLTQ